jgi:hypothetical protein
VGRSNCNYSFYFLLFSSPISPRPGTARPLTLVRPTKEHGAWRCAPKQHNQPRRRPQKPFCGSPFASLNASCHELHTAAVRHMEEVKRLEGSEKQHSQAMLELWRRISKRWAKSLRPTEGSQLRAEIGRKRKPYHAGSGSCLFPAPRHLYFPLRQPDGSSAGPSEENGRECHLAPECDHLPRTPDGHRAVCRGFYNPNDNARAVFVAACRHRACVLPNQPFKAVVSDGEIFEPLPPTYQCTAVGRGRRCHHSIIPA